MKFEFTFTVPGTVNKKEVENLLNTSENIGRDYKDKLKSCIGGDDIGYHKWHQIYDVIRFLEEYKFPLLWLNVLIIRGCDDKQFQRTFNSLLTSWLNILSEFWRFDKAYRKELQKIKEFKNKQL